MLKKLLFNLLLLTLTACFAYAQQSVRGKIIDNSTGEPVPGVSILVKGTTTGTASDVDGNYQIDISEPNPTLIFSSIGFTSQEVIVGNKSVIDIGLIADIQALEEVVVIGYGTREKKDLTGAISQIESDIIKQSTALTPEIAMQGRMPGVFVAQGSGNPNDRPTVRIRGVGTWGYAEPLYVIDGIPVAEAFQEDAVLDQQSGNPSVNVDLRGPNNILNTINPNDIESITVLKDASASAIYGVRAANGVVIITTKKGVSGAPKVTFNASLGTQKVTERFDVLNTQQFADLNLETITNAGLDINDPNYRWYNPSDPAYQGNSPLNEDWQDYALESGVVQDYSLSLSGGSQASTYYTSFGYSSQTGPIKYIDTERYSVTLNSDHKINKWLRIGENFRYSYLETDGNILNQEDMSTRQPWQPILDPTNPFGFQAVDTDTYGPSTDSNEFGERAAGNYQNFQTNRVLGNVFLEVTPLEGLRIRGTASVDLNQYKRSSLTTISGYQFQLTADESRGSQYGERVVTTTNLQREVLVGYNKSFGDHNFDLTLNGSWQEIREENLQVGSDENPVDGVPVINEATSVGVSFRKDNALVGYLGRISYNYAGKYYLDASVRRDGTSRFSDEFRWGTFPAVAAAWRISAEPFLQGNSFINDLKIRAGWGQLGNQVTASYQFLSLATLAPKYLSGGNDASVNADLALLGAFFPALPNLGITWETVTTSNIGFDALLLDNKLSFTAEYYVRETEDILQVVNIPSVAGYQASPSQNIGTVRNNGVELSAQYTTEVGQVGLVIGGNFTTVNNEVTKLNNGEPLNFGERRIEEGESINFLWGFKQEGIFQDQQEVDNYTTQDTQGSTKMPGDIYFQDLFGPSSTEGEEKTPGADGVINNFDRTFLGKTVAGHFYGFNLGANFQGFDFSLFFQGIGDVQKVNASRRRGEQMNQAGNNQWISTLNRWSPTNPSTTMPRAAEQDPANNIRFSDRWVEDAGYLRLRNLQIGYNFNNNVTNKVGTSGIRVYFDAQNLLTITDWSGLDPESDEIPLPKIYRLGLNVTF